MCLINLIFMILTFFNHPDHLNLKNHSTDFKFLMS